jgi:predicted nucleotide-binding protein (sugar kinase/HSP70/actin superfamily)
MERAVLPREEEQLRLAEVQLDQIQCYFSVNKLTTDVQHAYREGHSTCTALTKRTDDLLKEIDNKKIVGAVLLDFRVAFDVLDHNMLSKKRYVVWIQS